MAAETFEFTLGEPYDIYNGGVADAICLHDEPQHRVVFYELGEGEIREGEDDGLEEGKIQEEE